MQNEHTVLIEFAHSCLPLADISYFLNEFFPGMSTTATWDSNSMDIKVSYKPNGFDPAAIHQVLKKMGKGRVDWLS